MLAEPPAVSTRELPQTTPSCCTGPSQQEPCKPQGWCRLQGGVPGEAIWQRDSRGHPAGPHSPTQPTHCCWQQTGPGVCRKPLVLPPWCSEGALKSLPRLERGHHGGTAPRTPCTHPPHEPQHTRSPGRGAWVRPWTPNPQPHSRAMHGRADPFPAPGLPRRQGGTGGSRSAPCPGCRGSQRGSLGVLGSLGQSLGLCVSGTALLCSSSSLVGPKHPPWSHCWGWGSAGHGGRAPR